MDRSVAWALALVALAVAFDAASLLSLAPRLVGLESSPFSVSSVRARVDARGGVAELVTEVEYAGGREVPLAQVEVVPFHYNFTREPMPVLRSAYRPLGGGRTLAAGSRFEAVQALGTASSLGSAALLDVQVFPRLGLGIPGCRATFRLPPRLEPGSTVDLSAGRLAAITNLPHDSFSIHTAEGAPPTALRRVEQTAIPFLFAVLGALLVRACRADRAWLSGLGRGWWACLAAVVALASGLRAWYGASFHAAATLNNIREVAYAELLVSGGPISWTADSAYPSALALAYALLGTRLSQWGAEGTAMALSLAISLAHVAVLGLLGAALGGPRAGLAAAALLAALPLELVYGWAVQRTGMAMLCTSLSLLAAARGARHRSPSHAYASAAALGLGLFTIRGMSFIVLPWALFVWSCGYGARSLRGPVTFLALAALIPALGLMVDTMASMGEAPVVGGMDLDADYLAANAAWTAFFVLGGDHHSSLLTLLALAGATRVRRRRPRLAASLAALVLVGAAFLAVHRVPVAYCDQHRHLLFVYPALLLLAGEGATGAWERLGVRQGAAPRLALALAAGYVALVHASYLGGVLALRRCG